MRAAAPEDLTRFGPNPVLVLASTGGEAIEARRNVRRQMWIHGGGSAEKPLAATAGSLRLSDEHQAALVAKWNSDPSPPPPCSDPSCTPPVPSAANDLKGLLNPPSPSIRPFEPELIHVPAARLYRPRAAYAAD